MPPRLAYQPTRGGRLVACPNPGGFVAGVPIPMDPGFHRLQAYGYGPPSLPFWLTPQAHSGYRATDELFGLELRLAESGRLRSRRRREAYPIATSSCVT